MAVYPSKIKVDLEGQMRCQSTQLEEEIQNMPKN